MRKQLTQSCGCGARLVPKCQLCGAKRSFAVIHDGLFLAGHGRCSGRDHPGSGDDPTPKRSDWPPRESLQPRGKHRFGEAHPDPRRLFAPGQLRDARADVPSQIVHADEPVPVRVGRPAEHLQNDHAGGAAEQVGQAPGRLILRQRQLGLGLAVGELTLGDLGLVSLVLSKLFDHFMGFRQRLLDSVNGLTT